MEVFAKVYETKEHGQILVMSDTNDHCEPEIRFFFIQEGRGICSVVMSYMDTEEGHTSHKRYFQSMTSEEATDVVVGCKKEFNM